MKILHYSDKGLSILVDLYINCDLMITTGDLRFSDFISLETINTRIPSFGVYGNHDDGCTYMADYGIENVHNRIVEFQGMKIGGFQGCLRYNSREMQYTEEQAKVFADTFPYVDILILHAGPYGLLDDPIDEVHKGSKSIAKYVQEKKPRFIFCGHQYSDDEMLFESTKIYRTYGARVIKIDM